METTYTSINRGPDKGRCGAYIQWNTTQPWKEQNNATYSNMHATRHYHTKWSKSARERQIPYDITYMWNLNHGANEPNYKTEADPQTYEIRLMVAKGEISLGKYEHWDNTVTCHRSGWWCQLGPLDSHALPVHTGPPVWSMLIIFYKAKFIAAMWPSNSLRRHACMRDEGLQILSQGLLLRGPKGRPFTSEETSS